MIFRKLIARVLIWTGLATKHNPALTASHKTVKLGAPKVRESGVLNFKHTGYIDHIADLGPGDKVTFIISDKRTFKKFASAIAAAGLAAHGAGSIHRRTDEDLQVISLIRLK